MSRRTEVIRLWRRRIRKADIARLTQFTLVEVNQIIDSQKQIDAIERKSRPPETCEAPTPAEIAEACSRKYAEKFAFGKRMKPIA